MSGKNNNTTDRLIWGTFDFTKSVINGCAKAIFSGVNYTIKEINQAVKTQGYRKSLQSARSLSEPLRTTILTGIIKNWYDNGGDHQFAEDMFSTIKTLTNATLRRQHLVDFRLYCDKRHWSEIARRVDLLL